MKLPSFQFYPGDWMKDPALRSVSLEARGLWMDMLCLLFESARRGYLQHVSGQPVSPEQLARMTGCSLDQVNLLLKELETSGVFSRTEHGTIFSRRIVKDEQIRQLRAEHGKLGGNPKLKRVNHRVIHGDKHMDNHGDNHNANLKPTPSSSSSTSVNPPTPQGGTSALRARSPDTDVDPVPLEQRKPPGWWTDPAYAPSDPVDRASWEVAVKARKRFLEETSIRP